jgi:protein TonB
MADELPQFSPNQDSLFNFIARNLTYPQECVEGAVYIGFIVEPTGELSNHRILRGIHPTMDKHALKVFEKMPNWNPGTCNGEPISFLYTLPIRFRLARN